MATPKVLIVTGGMLVGKERSILSAIRRNLASLRASTGPWFDIETKAIMAEFLVGAEIHKRARRFRDSSYSETVRRFFSADLGPEPPELTEVSLATLLDRAGLPFETTTYAEVFSDRALRERLLGDCAVVFASTTLLRDMSELIPMVAMLARPGIRIVAGGALAGIAHRHWPGCPGLDVLAIGYGESLVPALAGWIRSGFRDLVPPPGGRVREDHGTTLLTSGLPEGKDLDDLPAPDWSLASRHHATRFRRAYYESARGCPYSCAFCNYPYLFDDHRFRYRSAERIAEDWEALARLGVEHVTCLDSLFTVPRSRIERLCRLLLDRKVRLRWICYARADDLARIETCELMREAGCHQVQIGLESGSQTILENMNKRSSVEKSALALRNCRKVGIATVTTIILGFPGETPATIGDSFELLRASPPDVYYAAPLNTRIEHVPLFAPEFRSRFGFVSAPGVRSSAPYWRHDTMDCSEVGDHLRRFHRGMMEGRVALEGSLFYRGLAGYDPSQAKDLLDFQYDVATGHPRVHRVAGVVTRWAHRRLRRDMGRVLGGQGHGAICSRQGNRWATPSSS